MGIWSDDSNEYHSGAHHTLRVDIMEEIKKNQNLLREVAPDENIEDYLLKCATSGNYEGRTLQCLSFVYICIISGLTPYFLDIYGLMKTGAVARFNRPLLIILGRVSE